MSSLLAVKLCRDLRASWSRFLMMTVAIAISLTAFGSVLFAWSASTREATSAYLSTEPASATILLDQAIDIDQMAAIAAGASALPGVIDATGRSQFTSDVEVNGQTRGIPLQLFVAGPDDPMRIARFDVAESSWPPGPDELFIGRDALDLLAVAVGDVVTVESPAGDLLPLRVAGTVYDPSLSPAPQEQTGHAYVSATSIPGPGGEAALDQLKLQVAGAGQTEPSADRDAIVAVATEVGQWLQRERGLAVREIQVPTPNAHPHRWQADTLLLSLLTGGAAALVLSTILVATMLNGLFTQQIPQIGIMKTVGARFSHIGRLYLAMTLLVAAAATLLALAPAVLLGRVAVGMFLGILGIEPASLAAPWWTYLVLVAVGLFLPPLMGLVPLVKASSTTVRAAIDHHGGARNSSAAAGALTRLSRTSRLDRGILLALRNTVRRPARFLLSVGLLACAGTVFVAGMSLSSGTDAIAQEQSKQRSWDVDVQLAAPAATGQVNSVVSQVPSVSRLEALNVTPTGVAGPGQIPVTRTYPDQGHGRVAVTALPAGLTTFTPPKLLAGRWLEPGETGAVVLNQVTRNNTVPDIRAGDSVQLIVGGMPTTWQVVGIVQERAGGGGAYTTAEGFAAATGAPEQVNQLRVFTDNDDEQTRQAIAAALTRALTDAGIEVRSAASISRSEAIAEGHLTPVILILLGVALPLGVVGIIGLASTMSTNVLDRTREFAVMHAIGARPKVVRRVVVAEGLFLAITSCLAAVIPALILTAVLGAGLGNLFFSAPLPYRISVLATIIWVAIATVGSILATDAAATRASRLPPHHPRSPRLPLATA